MGREYRYRERKIPVAQLAERQGLILESLVMARGNVIRYAVFPKGSLANALKARFFVSYKQVRSWLERREALVENGSFDDDYWPEFDENDIGDNLFPCPYCGEPIDGDICLSCATRDGDDLLPEEVSPQSTLE